MLTRDLLRFNLHKGEIFPRFVDVANRNLETLAQELIEVYSLGTGQSSEEIAESVQPLINAYRSPLIAKGINKLLLDRCSFQEPDPDHDRFRLELFTRSAHYLRQGGHGDLGHFRAAVATHFSMEPDHLAERLFADLPARQPLLTFKPIEPKALLERYNLAQAQGLLCLSTGMTVEIQETKVTRSRQLLRYLKFFRLMATVRPLPKGAFRIIVDGPLSLFHNTQKYGLLLASFLPAVCKMARWHMEAEVRLPNHK
ncbi:MAG: DUF790 family protein, partial [Magnetococcales bacterium]|nr:DUF790 family protein [Magnetococcales bacterium]